MLLPHVPLKLLQHFYYINTIANCNTDLWCIVQFIYFFFYWKYMQIFQKLHFSFWDFYKTLNACYSYISLPSPVCNNFPNEVNFRLLNSSEKYTVWHSFFKSWCKINQWQWFFNRFGSRVEFFSLDWLQGVFSFYYAVQNFLYQSLSL